MLAKLASSAVSALADPLADALTLASADGSVMMFYVFNNTELTSNVLWLTTAAVRADGRGLQLTLSKVS